MKEQKDFRIKKKVYDYFESLAENRWDQCYVECHIVVARRERIEELLESIPQGTVLDSGCGTGQFIQCLADRGDRYFGLDFSPKMIAAAKEKVEYFQRRGAQICLQVGDVEQLPVPDAYFDILIAAGLIQYFESSDKLMQEIRRVVKEGGTIVITAPTWSVNWLIEEILRKIYHKIKRRQRDNVVYRKLWTRRETRKLCRSYGFEPNGGSHYGMRLIGFPFDRFFPKSIETFNSRCEKYSQGVLKVFTCGYIVRCTKKGGFDG